MPLIQFDGPKLTAEQKTELTEKLTRAAKEVLEDIPEKSFIVLIREYDPENVGVGGKQLSQREVE